MKIQPLDFEKPIIELEEKLADIRSHSREHDVDVDTEVRRMEEKIEATKRQIYLNLTPWERVQIARHPARPYTLDYLQLSFCNFVELHGDRLFADDRAMPGGFATIEDRKCVVIGHQKGRELKENIKRNFGCANPEGYRKALRLMRIAVEVFQPLRIKAAGPPNDPVHLVTFGYQQLRQVRAVLASNADDERASRQGPPSVFKPRAYINGAKAGKGKMPHVSLKLA